MAPEPGPPRRRIDLTSLPLLVQYAIALAVVAVVVALVFALGARPRPLTVWQLVAAGAASVTAMLLVRIFRRRR